MAERPVSAFDTSVVVAALLTWHEGHAAARQAVEDALADGLPQPILPAHVLFESYAVLTRLPAPHRLRPEDAAEILAGSFQGAVRVAGLPPEASWDIISWLAGLGVAGGRTYDELILASALGAGATRLITFNPRHFDPQRIEIAVPGR